jgi:hypothetical protein
MQKSSHPAPTIGCSLKRISGHATGAHGPAHRRLLDHRTRLFGTQTLTVGAKTKNEFLSAL